MRARTTRDTYHGPTYGLPAGVMVEVEPEDLLGLVQYRVTWIHGPYAALREMNEWIPIYLNPEDVEEINEYTPAFHAY